MKILPNLFTTFTDNIKAKKNGMDFFVNVNVEAEICRPWLGKTYLTMLQMFLDI